MMETTEFKTSSQILTEAADLLEQEGRWTRGKLFRFSSSIPCQMCAHGAIAYSGDSQIRELVQKKNLHDIYPFCKISVPQRIAENNGPINESWNQTEMAHYKAAKVGLTTTYNDNSNSKEEVIALLREAAKLP